MTGAVPEFCPLCGGTAGDGSVIIQTRTFKELVLGGSKYLVRTVEVPRVCGPCGRGLSMRRFAADALCLVPGIVLALLGLATSKTMVMVFAGAYGLHVFRKLEYNWADWVCYGADLEAKLSPYRPEGDHLGYPANGGHMIARLAAVPVGLIMLVMTFGMLGAAARAVGVGQPGASTAPGAMASPARVEKLDPARKLLFDPWTFCLPYVAPGERLYKGVNMIVYWRETNVPSQYHGREHVMTKRLLEDFLKDAKAQVLDFADTTPRLFITKKQAKEILAEFDARAEAAWKAQQRADE